MTRDRSTRVTNDLGLVEAVIRLAVEPGYVIVGPAHTVYSREPAARQRGTVVPVPTYEADTVRQLLGSGHLITGGVHTITCGARTGPATSVLVPKPTRDMLARWAAYVPLRDSQ